MQKEGRIWHFLYTKSLKAANKTLIFLSISLNTFWQVISPVTELLGFFASSLPSTYLIFSSVRKNKCFCLFEYLKKWLSHFTQVFINTETRSRQKCLCLCVSSLKKAFGCCCCCSVKERHQKYTYFLCVWTRTHVNAKKSKRVVTYKKNRGKKRYK